MENYKLTGHSGCKLEVEEQKGLLIVVKTSKNIEYNDRLKQQVIKQKNFSHIFFKSPKIFYEKNDINGLYKFGMEYVNGVILSEYFKKIEISAIENMAKNFISIIPEQINFDPDAKKYFLVKISELEEKIDSSMDDIFPIVINKLKNNQWAYCTSGQCHGDMTLENVIWKDAQLYLIDFLDSFYDSWMIDFAKILQDVECKWSYRHEKNIDENLEIRLLIFKQMLFDKILSLENGKEILNTIYYILLLNLLRIIPYTKDEYTKRYLIVEIKKIFNKINI